MKKILIIEDNAEIRENTVELLEINQFIVQSAENGLVGYELAKKTLPDLILCDMMMPDTDGTRFLQFARADEAVRNIPVVFFSAGTPTAEVQDNLIKKSNGFLKKPFLEEELLGIVQGILNKNN